MNAGTYSSDLIHLAYRLLKQDTYYDKMDLFLCANVAAYEESATFQQRQDTSFAEGRIANSLRV